MDEILITYGQSEAYPFHMPGHKRQTIQTMNPYQIDITEIDGFDNLHHASGVIDELQQGWAKLYGCDRAFLLVNGTTCGNEAAIFAATKEEDVVIVARGCHQSEYHAMALRHLIPEYIMSNVSEFGVAEPISPQQVQEAIARRPEATTVIITAPSYEGLYPDVSQIASIVHEAGMTLVVDAAHGAHFGIAGGYPDQPIHQGADAVIVSLHKTLPVFTQVACLLWNSTSTIPAERIQQYLGYFESSSPSYVLMASAAAGLRWMESHGVKALEQLNNRLQKFRSNLEGLEHIKVSLLPGWESADKVDPTKILIRDECGHFSGEDIMQWLRSKAQLELEMATPTYALAMTSVMDTEEGFERLEQALRQLDQSITNTQQRKQQQELFYQLYATMPRAVYSLTQAQDMPSITVSMEEAAGKITADFIHLYPPGIPVYAPGERLTKDGLSAIQEAIEQGYEVNGITTDYTIRIIKE